MITFIISAAAEKRKSMASTKRGIKRENRSAASSRSRSCSPNETKTSDRPSSCNDKVKVSKSEERIEKASSNNYHRRDRSINYSTDRKWHNRFVRLNV